MVSSKYMFFVKKNLDTGETIYDDSMILVEEGMNCWDLESNVNVVANTTYRISRSVLENNSATFPSEGFVFLPGVDKPYNIDGFSITKSGTGDLENAVRIFVVVPYIDIVFH